MPGDYMEHYATFNGTHNSLKVKVLYSLFNESLNALVIYTDTGVNYRSLLTSLPKWVRWGYIGRRLRYNCYGNYTYVYSLLKKGRDFLSVTQEVAQWGRYHREINAFQAKTERVLINYTKYKSVNDYVRATKRARGEYAK